MDKTAVDTTGADRYGSVIALYRGLWGLLRPGLATVRTGVVLAYLCALGQIGASIAIPYYLALMLDQALPQRRQDLFVYSAAAVAVAALLLLVSALLTARFEVHAIERLFQELRSRLVRSVIRKRLSFFGRYTTGDLVTRISGDTETLAQITFDYAFPGLRHLSFVVVIVAFMLWWQFDLGLYTTLSIPIYLLLVTLCQRPLARAAAVARRRLSEQNETLLDILSGVREISFYQQQPEAQRRFDEVSGRLTHAGIRSVLIGEWSFNIMGFCTRVITLLPFLLGGYWIFQGRSDIGLGELIAYNLFLTYLASVLELLLYGWTRMIQVRPIAERLQQVLDYPEEEQQQCAELAGVMDSTRIEFRNVSFSHPGGKQVLDRFDLTIEPGEKLAIVGPSGAGKSTLIDLLIRQIEPDQGEILLDSRPISSYSLPLYLQQFGYVRQVPYLFRTSIRENIAAGWYGVPDEVIIAAARRVHLHEQIMQLPQGYATVIGTAGVDLSGGQRQRLALARALVRDPEILLLDEFTSALDAATEQALLDDLFSSFAKQTIICVTHSQAVAARFGRIVRIEKH